MKNLFILLTFYLFLSTGVYAETIVRMELQQGAVRNNVDLKLFNSAAPATVASFLKYTDTVPAVTVPPEPTESYNNSFIHRISAGLLVDGGAFTYTPGSPFSCTNCLDENDESSSVFPDGLQPVTADLPIPLEFKKSNVRGTITMRKILLTVIDPDKPVRASNWFINLSDNAALLDTFTLVAGGPYTAFGEVINDTMQTVDALEANPELVISDRTDIHFDFSELPLLNYTVSNEIEHANLIRINSIKKLFSVSSDVSAGLTVDTDFGVVLFESNNQAIVTISNLGADDLKIVAIASSDTLTVPFSIAALSNTCAGVSLVSLASCTFVVEFTSAVDSEFNDTFNIEFEFGDGIGIEKNPLNYSYSISGRSTSVIQPFIITSIDEVAYGGILVDSEESLSVFLKNTGTEPLEIFSIDRVGTDADEFRQLTDCITASPIAIDGTCEIMTAFSPKSLGEKVASLIVNSNAPSQPAFSISLSGVGDKDSDGILFTIEDAAPNAGDNNGDGIFDSQQDEVASFVAKNDEYISLISNTEFVFKNIKLVSEIELNEFPEDVRFMNGAFSFDVNIDQPGLAIEVGIILPSGTAPESYFLFGPTEDNVSPHWYKYTAVQIFGESTFLTPTGDALKRNVIRLAVQDGGVGDADGVVNGKITMQPGALAYPLKGGGSSGGSVHISLLIFFVVLLLISRFNACSGMQKRNEILFKYQDD